MSTPKVFCCPFFDRETASGHVICEVGQIRFPDKEARRRFAYTLCAANPGWENCSIAKMLVDYCERTEKNSGNGEN